MTFFFYYFCTGFLKCNFMKKFFCNVGLFLFFFSSHSFATDLNTVVIETKKEKTYRISTGEAPRFFFNNNRLELKGDVETSFDMSEIKSIYFASSGVTSTHSIEENLSVIYQDGNSVRIEGIEDGTEVILYSSEGKVLKQVKAEYGSIVISLPDFKGLYLLKVENQGYKFLRK